MQLKGELENSEQFSKHELLVLAGNVKYGKVCNSKRRRPAGSDIQYLTPPTPGWQSVLTYSFMQDNVARRPSCGQPRVNKFIVMSAGQLSLSWCTRAHVYINSFTRVSLRDGWCTCAGISLQFGPPKPSGTLPPPPLHHPLTYVSCCECQEEE